MRIETVLKWISRGLFVAGGALFAGLFVYLATHADTGGVTSGGESVNYMSADQVKVLALLFSASGWSFMGGAAARTLASAQSWPRAITSIAGLLGFAVMFSMPIFAIAGDAGRGGAVAVFVAGFVVVLAAKLVGFAMFGAKDAVDNVTHGIEQFTTLVAAQQASRVRRVPGLAVPATPVSDPGPPPPQTLSPEPLRPEPHLPGS